MKRKGTISIILTLLFAPQAYSLDLGGAAMKLWEKKDAIVKTGKAFRKGFAELTPKEEHFIGRTVAAKILSKYKPVNDKRKTEYINTLGQTLARYSSRPETYGGYHFLLVESDQINAFAAPGGFIFITTGLYKSANSEEELALALAHEIAHVTLKHGLGAIKSSRLTEAFTILGTEAVKEYGSGEVAQLTSVFEGTIDDVVNKMVVSGYSKSQEYDADEEAIKIAYRAGYDPSGLLEMLKTLEQGTNKKEGGFYSTHPPASDRLKKAEAFVKELGLEAEQSTARNKRFASYAIKR